MIKKLVDEATLEDTIKKVNEISSILNALYTDYELHYHETLDTHYNTGYPKIRADA